MARKTVKHVDGIVETWDDATGFYVKKDSAGTQLAKRALNENECSMLDPHSNAIKDLQAVVDQLILDSLMGGLS